MLRVNKKLIFIKDDIRKPWQINLLSMLLTECTLSKK